MAPSVGLAGRYARNKDEITFGGLPPPLDDFGADVVVLPGESLRGFLRVEQPIVVPQVVPLWRGAQRSVEASEEGYSVAIQETAFGVAEGFYGVLRAEADARVTEETLKVAEDERRRAQLRYEVGELVKADLLRAEVTVARAKQVLTAATNRVRLARKQLGRLIGEEVLGALEEPSVPVLPADNPDAAVAIAEQNRPDLRRSDRLLQAAIEESRRRIAALLPTVAAGWTYQRTDTETLSDRDNFWTFTVGLRVPLIERGGALWIDVKEQKYRVEQARLEYEALRRDVHLEVRRRWLEVDTLEANLVTAREERDLADETHRLVSQQYDAGTATSLEATTALTDRQRARVRFVDTRYGRDVAVLALRRATGDLVRDVRGEEPGQRTEEQR
jgi:outer membrane protein